MSEMITADLVDLDLSADTKEAAARALAERMVALGRVTDLEGFLADVAAREAQMPTGLDGGIGIPHCRSEHVTEPTLAFGRSAAGIDFGAPDGPADLIFLIAAPAGADDAHLTILSSLARQLMNTEFTDALRAAGDAAGAAALIRGDEAPGAAVSGGDSEGAAGTEVGARGASGAEGTAGTEVGAGGASGAEGASELGVGAEAASAAAAGAPAVSADSRSGSGGAAAGTATATATPPR
ncbi:PTS sugar transporter subunit IIA, partial [Streptomyces griseorubiginosus]|uniref:PTS sugar transporter subunit IIA n=1 Tax=Streptomyces griseorubiginosus TaxID=67304 RepID=UPI003687FA74